MLEEAESIPSRVNLLVVGGGIYGAWTAGLAARAGLSTLLIEQGDWGSGTSSWSSKLIHGGLRYLEYYDLPLVRKALRERQVLRTVARQWVRPIRFVSPIWTDHRYPPWKMSLGLGLYDALGGRKQPVQRHSRHPSANLLSRCPYLEADNLRAGFSYGDCSTDDARLVWTLVAEARMHGAVCRSRVRALEPWVKEGRCRGVRLQDLARGIEQTCEADEVIYATGPWIRGLQVQQLLPPVRMTKGVHLVMPALPPAAQDAFPDLLPDGRHAFLLTAPSDRRVFFLIPWYGRTLLGTTDTDYHGDPALATVTADDQRYLLDALRARCPGLGWGEDAIQGSFAGVRTMQASETEDPGAVSREWEARQLLPGLTAYIGGKLTSARADAASALTRLYPQIPRGWDRHPLSISLSATEEQALYHTHADVEADCLDHWIARYGRNTSDLIRLAQEEGGFERIVEDLPFRKAELSFARRFEDVQDEEDLVRRRVPLSILAPESVETLPSTIKAPTGAG